MDQNHSRVIYLAPLSDESIPEDTLRFRLTYEGDLRSTQRDPETGQRDKMAEHKQSIRKVFHRQLKHFWETNKFLKNHTIFTAGELFPGVSPAKAVGGPGYWGGGSAPDTLTLQEALAQNFSRCGYRFVPLVCEGFELSCSLDILFLRSDSGGGIVSAGDLDNRVKTLIDALRMPKGGNELRGNEIPAQDENPFFCLLEDDNLVTALAVESDLLLGPSAAANKSLVKLVISVSLKPSNVTMNNLSFA